MKRIIPLLVSLLIAPVFAGEYRHPAPQKPEPTVSSDGSNHNAIAIAVVIAAGVCLYHRCWQKKPVQDNDPTRMTPEVKTNEYIYTIKP